MIIKVYHSKSLVHQSTSLTIYYLAVLEFNPQNVLNRVIKLNRSYKEIQELNSHIKTIYNGLIETPELPEQ